jgi:hypothetical protein
MGVPTAFRTAPTPVHTAPTPVRAMPTPSTNTAIGVITTLQRFGRVSKRPPVPAGRRVPWLLL